MAEKTPATSATPSKPAKKKSLVSLVGDLPTLVRQLVTDEIDLLKVELIGKIKSLGIGAGLFVGAAIVLLGMIGVLLTAGILALSLVMPGWLAALLVALLLLIIAGVLVLIGWRIMKKGLPPIPTETIDSLKHDVWAIRGLGKRETRERL